MQTPTFREKWEVEPKLSKMAISRDGLIKVVTKAVAEANNSTPNDVANAAGTFSYIFGTRAMRDEFCGTAWCVDRRDSVESIRNEGLKLKIVFQNVDCACDDDRFPKPRSKKGSGSERACIDNRQGTLFPNETPTAVKSLGGYLTWYLMVAYNGAEVRAELSLPIVKDGTFIDLVERVYLITDGEWLNIDINIDDDEGNFDITVSRK